MALTKFEQLFKNTLLKITDNIDEIYAQYLCARTDNIRQKIIDLVRNGKIKNMDEVAEITFKLSPAYQN
jgi:hypothetical protein